ncbi:uncharacterized protein BXZ73DRAFT_104779 [Epithele typhae]|uniref:uncharacterized protein n=1 Tax=Epithele typhae TaxID=378194 RepID=UPI002007B96C|nr:uncharacterized protein BXZ73DRAFT_104779 [Epithele typhae]KAH9919959.1 hypothetical protein BXZ73DRAFT_104779 [Epithele typhae]
MADATPALPLCELSLYPATRQQTLDSRRRHFEQWGRGMPLEEYLRRDDVLDSDPHAANGNMITWVLVRRTDPTSLTFLSSCETYRRTATASRRSSSTAEDVTAYGVASVFTAPANRRKGYARHMMRLLHWVLAAPDALDRASFPAAWGAPPDPEVLRAAGVANGRFSVLYSDLGRDFYHACGPRPDPPRAGWATLGARETFFVLSAESTPRLEDVAAAEEVELARLGKADVEALYAHDARWLRADVARAAAAAPQRVRLAFLPDAGVGAFVMSRLMDFDMRLRPTMNLRLWGAAVVPAGQAFADVLAAAGEGREEEVRFVSWTYELRTEPKTVVVARLRADERTFPKMVGELVRAAEEHGCTKIEFWSMPDNLRGLAEKMGFATKERTDHLSAIKWYGDEGEEELDWLYNEKYCWC